MWSDGSRDKNSGKRLYYPHILAQVYKPYIIYKIYALSSWNEKELYFHFVKVWWNFSRSKLYVEIRLGSLTVWSFQSRST